MGNYGDDSDCPTIRDQSRLLRGNGDCNDVLGAGDVEVGVALFGELDRIGSSSAGPTSIAIGPWTGF
jgi:hypothetical protein